MLVLAAAWGMLAAASFVVGRAVLGLTDVSPFTEAGDQVVVSVWTGTLTIALALLTVSLVFPLSAQTCLLLILALVGTSLLVPETRRAITALVGGARLWPTIGVIALSLGVGYFCSQPVLFPDTQLYHAGAIEWLSRYGSVRGVAFLEYRFGFTTSWFALAAVFNHGPLTDRVEALSGGYALWLGAAHFVMAAARVIRGSLRLPDWFAAIAYLVVLVWAVRVGIPVSPSPDLPVIFMCIVVAWSLLVVGPEVRPPGRSLGADAIPTLLAALTFPLKPTAAPLLAVSLVFYLWRSGLTVRFAGLCGLVGLAVLPGLVVSVTTTGCPLFPSPTLCTNAPWSLGSALASHDQAEGRVFLEWTGVAHPADANNVNWIPHWLRNEPLATLAILYLLGASAAIAWLRPALKTFGGVWMVALGGLGVAWVLLLSPTYRFMIGYAVLPSAYAGALLCTRWKLHALVGLPAALFALLSIVTITVADQHSNRLIPSAIFSAAILPVGALSAGAALQLRDLTLHAAPARARELGLAALPGVVAVVIALATFLEAPSGSLGAPPSLTAPSHPIAQAVNDVHYLSPPDDQLCWAVIPCSAEHVDPRLHLLDPSRGLAGGFAR